MAGPDDLEFAKRQADGSPAGALVLLHGRGTDEEDILPLADDLDPDRRLLAVAPRGPLSLPPGGSHWYKVRRVGFPEPDTFIPSFEALSGWLDQLDVTVERTVIAGFSQGGVMAYALGLGEGRPRPAGIVALSSFMPTVEGFALDLDGLDGYPVAIGHGTFDPIIESSFGREAKERLAGAGADVLWRESPLPHTVDPDFLPELAEFVRRAVGD
jgi:phospholipase/carboxylesterase